MGENNSKLPEGWQIFSPSTEGATNPLENRLPERMRRLGNWRKRKEKVLEPEGISPEDIASTSDKDNKDVT